MRPAPTAGQAGHADAWVLGSTLVRSVVPGTPRHCALQGERREAGYSSRLAEADCTPSMLRCNIALFILIALRRIRGPHAKE